MENRETAAKTILGLIQLSVSEPGDGHLKKTLAMTREAAGRGAQIICLPELFRTPYFPQEERQDVTAWAEPIPGLTTEAFSPLARELGIVVILPLYEKAPDGVYYNSAVVLDADGRLLETYRKIHIPHDRLFYEQNYFSPGDLGYPVYHTRYGSFSVLICYDQWFPEAARACALQGAQILFYPTAIGRIGNEDPGEEDWHGAWETIQRGHAIANGIHVAAVNRVGGERSLRFWGGSFVSDAFGTILRRAGSGEKILLAGVDLEMNRRVRTGWGFFRNRRPDTYHRLLGAGPPDDVRPD